MKLGFVTFCTQEWMGILENLIESVLSFSKYDIYVYSINFDYTGNSDRVVSKRVDINYPNYFNICKTKIFSSVDCPLDIGLVLDCDMIVTNQIDKIFDDNYSRLLDSKFPLFAKHPLKVLETWPHFLTTIRQYTDKEPKMKWVYASYMFSNSNKWFLQEVLDEMNKLDSQAGEDELIINALLTKYEVDYDIGYNYLPNGLDDMFDLFFNIKEDTIENNWYLQQGVDVRYYVFHGHKIKDVFFGKNLIKEIKKL
jgi:hypothetical protein